MTDGLAVRLAQAAEAHLLSEVAFRSKSHWGYPADFMEACRAELSVSESDIDSPSRHYVVAEFQGSIAGYYALEFLSPDEWELEAIFVEPQEIGQGIGRALIEHAKSHARRNGVRSLIIQGDPNAVRFYMAAGGVQVGERESDSIPGRYLPEFRIFLDAEGPE